MRKKRVEAVSSANWPGVRTRITYCRDAIRDVMAALQEGRIDAHYQPVVRLDSREIAGVQALFRMILENGEVLAPTAFQAATSDVHVAAALTSRMLSIVAEDVRGWLDKGFPLQRVGVNISNADFYTGDLLAKLDDSFGRAGIPLDRLILEVNEDVYTGTGIGL